MSPVQPFVFIFFISALISILFFEIHRNVGLDFADEGYLWYGVERVFQGETPILDFQSYDPGRYYWSALWFHLWRPGLVPLRFSETFFEFLGIFAGLWTVQKYVSSRWEVAGIGFLLGLWMFPDYKFFDCCLPLLAILIGFKFFDSSNPRQAMLAWIFIGLVFWIGRNHGLYLWVSFLCLTILKNQKKQDWYSIWFWSLVGFVLGLLPFAWIGVEKKDFLQIYFSVAFQVFQLGATNLPLPIHWIWTLFQRPIGSSPEFWFLTTATNGLPLIYFFWIYRFWKHQGNPSPLDKLLLVCALVGIPYFHYFFSRADLQHLAVALSPFWVGVSVWMASHTRRYRIFLSGAIGLSFLWITAPYHFLKIPLFNQKEIVKYEIGLDKIYLRPDQADFLTAVTNILNYRKPGQTFLALPYLPSLYAVFGLKSPCWQIYPWYLNSTEDQNKMIDEMKRHNVRWALIENFPLDGREELKFQNTNPLVWKYLNNHYRLFPKPITYTYDFLFFNPNVLIN